MITNQQALTRLKADIQLRGLSRSTQRSYLTHVGIFLEDCKRPIEELDETDIRNFLGRLIVEKKLAPGTINIYGASIRFFFAVTLNRTMNYLQIPRVKAPKKLPEILTRDEVAELIACSANLKHKALIMTTYGSGLRVSELISLKTKDIDSDSMRVFVRAGKGQKDRYTILSEASLLTLREYWRKYRPKSPEGFIFPGVKNIGHITDSAVSSAIDLARSKALLQKNVTPHTLRHCFATHLLEDGLSLLQIKELLGHYSIQSTTIYLHLANVTGGVISPADKLPEVFEDCTLW
jgi:site-specific recombinase XerD